MKVFSPPFEEFEVASVSVPAGATLALPVNPGPQLLLVQGGGGSAAASPPTGAARVESPVTLVWAGQHRGRTFTTACNGLIARSRVTAGMGTLTIAYVN